MKLLKNKKITLRRDVQGTLIPSGTPIVLSKGEKVSITQDLGGYTTVEINGALARIEGRDSDALGKKKRDTEVVLAKQKALIGDGTVDKEAIFTLLKTCFDPEIPVNIVDLGLIYGCEIEKINEPAGNRIVIQMTLTAPGCGMGPILIEDVKQKVLQIANVTDADVQLVWDPPWDQSRLSEEAMVKLGLL